MISNLSIWENIQINRLNFEQNVVLYLKYKNLRRKS